MAFEIITANNAEQLKEEIEKFKNIKWQDSYYKYCYPDIQKISITTNNTDYVACVEYYSKGSNVY